MKLKKGSIPKKNIARTIAGEVVVSERFATVFKQRGSKGVSLESVTLDKGTSNYYQLMATSELELTMNTAAGVDISDFSEGSEPTEKWWLKKN